MIDLATLGERLTLGEGGCWYAPDAAGPVSYPADGNDTVFDVEEDSFWFRHRNGCILDAVRAYPPAGPIFDVGGGNGVVAVALERAGVPTVLVEPGRRGALNARRRGCTNVVCANLERAGFAPGSLPAAALFDVLEHIEDDWAFLAFLRSRLRAGGRLYLTVPAYAALWSADDVHAGHFRRYTLSGLCRLLREEGFAIDFRSYLFWFLPLPMWCSRTLPTWLGRRRAATGSAVRSDHVCSRPWRVIVDACLGPERWVLTRGIPMPFGTSCLVVARVQG